MNKKEELKSYFIDDYNIPEIIEYIDEIDSIYKFKFNNIECNVYYRKTKDSLDISKIQRAIKRGAKISKTSNSLLITLILSPVKKIIETNKILTSSNINSGFTFTNSNEIFIFRNEEFSKVILHEIIHHDKLIHNDLFKSSNKKRLLRHFQITNDTILILNEAIVEFWATLVHIGFVSCLYKIPYNDLFKKELEYSLFKSYQILRLKETYKNKLWCDKCNIYSYIIFKTILLQYINDFLGIYTYPYDDTKITNFLIDHSGLLEEILRNPPKNPSIIINNQLIFREPSSLCLMLLSDL